MASVLVSFAAPWILRRTRCSVDVKNDGTTDFKVNLPFRNDEPLQAFLKENGVEIEAKPPNIFDRAAITAALKFKYKPKVVNGEPIDVAGVLHRITFELED